MTKPKLDLGPKDDTCPVCGINAIVQIAWVFYAYDSNLDCVVKRYRHADAYLYYKRDYSNISNYEMINIYDIDTVDHLTPEQFHRHHIQMQNNTWYRQMTQMVNERILSFMDNREMYFIMPYGSKEPCPQPMVININWFYGVTDNEQIEQGYNAGIRGKLNPGAKQAIPCTPIHPMTESSEEELNFVSNFRYKFVTQNKGILRNTENYLAAHLEWNKEKEGVGDLTIRYRKDKRLLHTRDRVAINLALDEPLKKVPHGLIKRMNKNEQQLFKAKKKADKLLKSWLSPKEYRSLKCMDEITIPDPTNPSINYCVERNPSATIAVYNNGNLQEYWCIQGDDPRIPASDRLLMKIINFKTQPKEMEKMAVKIRANG